MLTVIRTVPLVLGMLFLGVQSSRHADADPAPALWPQPRPSCPAVLDASVLLLAVTSSDMNDQAARVRLYLRDDTSAPWQATDFGTDAVMGHAGLGWAWDQLHFSQPGEPEKREGDGRTPAGIFSIGNPFGFESSSLSGYLDIAAGHLACVDDPASELYNEIVPAESLPDNVSHEKMWLTMLYRHGIVVDHKANGRRSGGSCIFLHIWRGPGKPTVGCVAMEESAIVELQDRSSGLLGAIAILSESGWERLRRTRCDLPLLE